AVSPVIDLDKRTDATLSFDHAAKFQTSLKELCGVYVKEAASENWEELVIPTWPEAGAWTFVNSGNIDLSDYLGKKIQIGFKYGSTDSAADTWEIKNLFIKGETTSISDTIAEENAPVEFFNLQGIRVANPENGIFIRRQGSNVSKVYVK
ncbi:MAG: DUF5017 domain-containing protein, partial [Muribaculaceae bacterium]|nr:DUF5017 domain-containing protein [Muribaculaceae bacterium]